MFIYALLQTTSMDNTVTEQIFVEEKDFDDAYWSAMKDSNIKLVTVNPQASD